MPSNPMTPATDPFTREREAVAALDQFIGEHPDGAAPPGYHRDGKGRLVLDRHIPDTALEEDSAVRTIIAYALDLHRQIQRFIGHCYDDLVALDELLGEKYGLRQRGGAKGNRTYMTYDGLMKVVIQVQDQITFGPELQVAHRLVQECIVAWGDGASEELLAIARHAFEADKEGRVSREKVFALRRLDLDHPKWRGVQDAITDAIRIIGSTMYIRFYVRATTEHKRWIGISVDLTGSPLPERLSA